MKHRSSMPAANSKTFANPANVANAANAAATADELADTYIRAAFQRLRRHMPPGITLELALHHRTRGACLRAMAAALATEHAQQARTLDLRRAAANDRDEINP